MKTICVFCGSSPGKNPAYREAAIRLGTVIAEQGMRLVYGGSRIGLMRELSDAALAAGGEVIGVITTLLRKKVGHTGLTKLYVVRDMHSRKMKMFGLSDAFIAMPGGTGTFEEILEVMTWAQLGMHKKPFGLLNTCGYYNKLTGFLDYARDEGFIKPPHRDMMLCLEKPEQLLDALRHFQIPSLEKWTEIE